MAIYWGSSLINVGFLNDFYALIAEAGQHLGESFAGPWVGEIGIDFA